MASIDARGARTAPWPRTHDELAAEWRRVDELARGMTASSGATGAELTREQRCLVGIWAAARWTVGDVAVSPMSRRIVAPAFDAAMAELDAAERAVMTGGPGWEWASGVSRWLEWLIGAQGEVRYPRA